MAKRGEATVEVVNKLNVEAFYQTLAKIIGEREGVEIQVEVTRKESVK